MFITFEGGDGSGKSTQARILVEELQKAGMAAIFTREPGGTELAEKIRGLLLERSGVENPLTEFLLLTAARHNHVEALIKPQLKEGVMVVCDRFFDSSIAYQGYTKGLDTRLMRKLHQDVFGDFKPHITFLIDVDPKVGLARITAERESNHYDARDVDFHAKVREGLTACARLEPERFRIIDGNQSVEAVAEQVLKMFKQYRSSA